MGEGEELPPVVATLVGDDESFLAMLERDAVAARATATEIQQALSEGFTGLTVSGSEITSQGVGAAGAVIGEQLATGIEEGAGGLDLRPEMQGALSGAAEAGQVAGEQLGEGVTEGAAGAGAAAGGEVASAFDEATAGLGTDLGDRLAAGVEQAAPLIAQTATGAVGQAFAAGMTGALASSALEAGALSGLAASLGDAAAEAGGSAGVELSRNLSEAAVGALSEADFAAFTDMLVATASSAGAEAGAAAAETLGASMSASMTGVDLIAEGLSTAGQSMKAGAQAVADEIAQVEEATLSGTQAFEAELDAVFESIWQGGQGMTVRLAAAMTEAFQGIEADTSGFSAAELMIFREFYDTLDQMGDQAAQSFAERMRLVQQEAVSGADIMASSMSTIGLPMPGGPAGGRAGTASSGQHSAQLAAENAAAMGEMGAAADTAEVAVGGLGATMGGPLMWGLLGVASMLPMVSGLFNSGSQAAQAYAQQQSQLQQAVAQDSNMIGANTVSTIAGQLATSGAADTLKGYGISLSDATAAMAGVKSAQTDVNGTLQNQIDNLQALISEQEAHATSGNAEIDTEKQKLAQLQATHDAMTQLEQDTVNAVQHDNDLAQATLNAEAAADVFNVQVRAGVLALEQRAQSAKVNAQALIAYDMELIPGSQAYTDAVHNQGVALANSAIQEQINAQALNASLAPQAQLSGAALQAALNYQQASAATSAYTGALTALYGQYGTTSQAQAAFTTSLDGLKGQITDGKNAVDLNTAAGAKNFAQFQQVAQAAESYAEKLYQQTGDSQQATQALQDMAGKLDTAAAKAHLTKDQVHELNVELFGVPDVKDITIKLDKTPAEQQMSELDLFIQGEINSINSTPITPGGGRAAAGVFARADGGPVSAGQPYLVGERGRPELFVPGADGYITPMDMLTPATAATAAAGGYGASGPIMLTANIYLDGELVGQQVMTGTQNEAQAFVRRNSISGFAGVNH